MEVSYNLNIPAHIVFDHLTNMQKFAEVHPVIYKIEPKDYPNYLVYEKLKFLFIPFSFKYLVELNSHIEKQTIRMRTRVKKMVTIEINFQLIEKGKRTLIIEKIEFRSFLPIHFVMKRIFKKQHQTLFTNIEKSIQNKS